MKDGNKDEADSGSNDIVQRGEDGICGDGVMRRALEHPCREVPALYTTTSSAVIFDQCFHQQIYQTRSAEVGFR